MAIDWTLVVQNLQAELETQGSQILVKTKVGVQGGSKTFRDFKDIATLDTIQRNREASTERDNNGIASLAEIDFNQ